MGHGLDFVNLENAQIGLPSVRFEQRIMVDAEMRWDAATVNSRVEHAAQINAVTAPACTPSPTMRRVDWSMTRSIR